ncbi:MAG: hypothetical protein HC831_05525 [Chloroflexia bacterium]|nr:hypothetical protein [Chloroflexia bacterium]
MNKKDLIGAILLVLIIVIEIINRQIKSNFSFHLMDKIFIYWYNSGDTTEIKPGFDIRKCIDNDSLVVSQSKTNLWITLLGVIVIFGFAIYSFLTDELYVISLVLAYILLKAVYYIFKELNNDMPKIVIKKEGIATRQLGFIKWEEVKLVQFRDTSSNETDSTNLDIFLTEKLKWKRPEFTIAIDGLDKSKEEIRMSVYTYSGYKHLMS